MEWAFIKESSCEVSKIRDRIKGTNHFERCGNLLMFLELLIRRDEFEIKIHAMEIIESYFSIP